jgi:UDP-N-acetylmuramate--alanine ligase
VNELLKKFLPMTHNAFGKSVYCIGIGGVGVSAIARISLHSGARVLGSDMRRSPLIDDLVQGGADIVFAPDPSRITAEMTVIYSDDVPPNHPERAAATACGATSYSFAEALGIAMSPSRHRVAIAGTNGKSTTTSITGLLAANAGLDPMVFVGSRLKEFQGNVRFGGTEYFIAEADEYRDHFLHYHPTIATVTNIELDHVDYFKTMSRMVESFQRFVTPEMQLIANADNRTSRDLWTGRAKTTWFGFGPDADVRVHSWKTSSGQQEITIAYQGKIYGPFRLRIPGKINVENAVAAMTTAFVLGIPFESMTETLDAFRGIWRRFDILTPDSPITVINDYAHHPTSVQATITAAKSFFPNRRIIAVFQPHHRHRLHALFDGFANAFTAADVTILTDIYVVAGRDEAQVATPTSADLLTAIERHDQPIVYAPKLSDVQQSLRGMCRPGDVVLLMGAGDIWELGQPLATAFNHGTA